MSDAAVCRMMPRQASRILIVPAIPALELSIHPAIGCASSCQTKKRAASKGTGLESDGAEPTAALRQVQCRAIELRTKQTDARVGTSHLQPNGARAGKKVQPAAALREARDAACARLDHGEHRRPHLHAKNTWPLGKPICRRN